MNLSVTKVSINESLSEETNCFSATMLIDGKPVLVASNRGCGGENECHPYITPKMRGDDAAITRAYSLMHDAIKQIGAYAATRPQVNLAEGSEREAAMYQPDLHWVIDELVEKALAAVRERKGKTKFRKDLASKVLVIDGKYLRQSKPISETQFPAAIAYFQKKYPTAVIVDRTNADAAWELVKNFYFAA